MSLDRWTAPLLRDAHGRESCWHLRTSGLFLRHNILSYINSVNQDWLSPASTCHSCADCFQSVVQFPLLGKGQVLVRLQPAIISRLPHQLCSPRTAELTHRGSHCFSSVLFGSNHSCSHVEMEKPGSGEVCCLPKVMQGHGGAVANSVGLTLGPPSRQGLQSGGLSCRAEHPNPISTRQDSNPSPCHPPSSAKLLSRPRLSHKGSSPLVPFWTRSECFQVRQQHAWPA